MKPNELIEEQHYFFLTFYDKKSKIPKINTVIFIGKILPIEKKHSKKDEWCTLRMEGHI